MASKGLRKDREGFMSMTDDDIRAVEKGTTNYLYNDWPNFLIRVHTTFWEIYWYRQTGNPTGHTLSQRLELWKAARAAIKHRPLFGWGTGDVFIAVEYGLDTIDSQLENTRMKPHNQYLLYLVLFGLTIFCFFSLYFGIIHKPERESVAHLRSLFNGLPKK